MNHRPTHASVLQINSKTHQDSVKAVPQTALFVTLQELVLSVQLLLPCKELYVPATPLQLTRL